MSDLDLDDTVCVRDCGRDVVCRRNGRERLIYIRVQVDGQWGNGVICPRCWDAEHPDKPSGCA